MVSLGSKVYSIQLACCHDFNSHTDGLCNQRNVSTEDHSKSGLSLYYDKLVLKGVGKYSKQDLTFEDYFKCLKEQSIIRLFDHRIQSRNQRISSTMLHKVALSTFCDKRYILDCGIHSVPYGMTSDSRCTAAECCQK